MDNIFIRRLRLHVILLFCFLYFFYGCSKDIIKHDLGASVRYEPTEISPGIELGAVYTSSNFAAFTDIVYYNYEWYVIFRAGTQHLGGVNGQIKILTSKDKVTWAVSHIIENDSLDLRGPKFILDSLNNQLYVNFFGTIGQPTNVKEYRLYNFIVTYNANDGYSIPQEVTNDNPSNENFAFWRYTYYKGKIYSAAYRIPLLGGYTKDNISLFNDVNDFKKYSTVGKIDLGKSPNEATIRFDANENMYYLIRRETANVILGISQPSDYCKVKWVDDPLGIRLSSPNFLFYHDKLLICGRDQDKLTFKLFSYNLTTNKIEKQFTFPSGIETGYGGMSFNPSNPDELFISYYVITNRKNYIYLAQVDLNAFLQ